MMIDDPEERAIAALAAFYAHVIRKDYDPDHSAPEDAADVLAAIVVAQGLSQLAENGHDYYLELRE